MSLEKNLTQLWINLIAEPFWLETLLVVAVLTSSPLAWPFVALARDLAQADPEVLPKDLSRLNTER